MNKMHVIHMFICFIYRFFFELVIRVYCMSSVWEDTNGYANKDRCELDIYLITVLLSLYGIIIYGEINAPGHGNNVVNGLNETLNVILRGK